jgi:hypothetical protein
MHRHRRRIRTPQRQPDLFSTPQPPMAATAPAWSSLPDGTQQAVMALMTRLLITPVAGAVSAPGGEADER